MFVEGEPRIRKYTDKEGIQRTAFEIHMGPQSVIRMLGGERNGRSGEHVGGPVGTNGSVPNAEKGDPGPGDIDLGEIPICRGDTGSNLSAEAGVCAPRPRQPPS